MDTTTVSTLPRFASTAATSTRRSTFRGLIAGSAVTVAGGLLHGDTAAGREKSKKRKKQQQDQARHLPEMAARRRPGAWTGPRRAAVQGGYGRCLLESTDGNLCAELLFRAKGAPNARPRTAPTAAASWPLAAETAAATARPAMTSFASDVSRKRKTGRSTHSCRYPRIPVLR